jgi:predicted MFS family arabinose efflux permease
VKKYNFYQFIFRQGVQNPSSLISIIGFTNIFGRIAAGALADLPSINSLLLNNMCLVLCSVALFGIPFCHDYTTYVVACIIFAVGLCE